MNGRRFFRSTFLAWLIFIGIDFLIHASLLEKLWAEDVAAIKPSLDLAVLIPVGYTSFLLLTILVGFVCIKVYPNKPSFNSFLKFGLIFGFFYALSNLLAVYSYVNIPLNHLLFINVGYLIEICFVVYVYYKTYYEEKKRKHFFLSILYFLILIFVGVIVQNIFG